MISFDELKAANQRAKTGEVDEPYKLVSDAIKEGNLPDYGKMTASWILYYYLKSRYETIGSVAARTVLAQYINLNGQESSMLHSIVLRLAIKISEKYSDFDFVEFVKLWGIGSFSTDDKKTNVFNGKEYPSLYEAVIIQSLKSSKSLDKVRQVFEDDDVVLTQFSKDYYFRMYNASKSNASDHDYMSIAEAYLNQTSGIKISNEYHSRILNALLFKLKEDDFRFLEVFRIWDFNNFRNEDWVEPKGDNGVVFHSLASKAITRFLKLYKSTNPSEELSIYHSSLLDYSLIKDPDSETFVRAYSDMLISSGDKNKAYNLLKQLIIKSPKWYLWEAISRTRDEDSIRLGFLCKALETQKDDKFTVKVRLSIAERLINLGKFSEALYELNKYEAVFTQNGWPLKFNYQNLRSSIPQGTRPSDSNDLLYRDYINKADFLFYEGFPKKNMAFIDKRKIEDKHIKGRFKTRFILMAPDGMTIQINPNNFGVPKNTRFRTCFEVIYSEAEKKRTALALIQIDETESGISFKTVEGTLDIKKDRKGNDFAKIQDVYINRQLLSGHLTGEIVKVLALVGADRDNWKSYRLERIF